MKEFDNYVFDLYGTLIDIHTDEENPDLWIKMAKYLRLGWDVNYTGPELRSAYIKICADEEEKLQKQNGARYPEIQIEKVWQRLVSDKNATLAENDDNAQKIRDLCVYFRETSRDKLEVYGGVVETLDKLRKNGRKIFLLSNAQRAFTEKELEETGLSDKFDKIYISSDAGIKKPQKEFLKKLIMENSLASEKTVMVGNDIFSDVGVAFANGINSIFLNTYNYSDERIDKELRELGIKGSCFMPAIINGDNLTCTLWW